MGNCCFNETSNTEASNLILIDQTYKPTEKGRNLKTNLRSSKIRSYKDYIKTTASKEPNTDRSINQINKLTLWVNDDNYNTLNIPSNDNNYYGNIDPNLHNNTLKRNKEIKDKEVNMETINMEEIIRNSNNNNKGNFANKEYTPYQQNISHTITNDDYNNSISHNHYLFNKFNYLFDDEPKIGKFSSKKRKSLK